MKDSRISKELARIKTPDTSKEKMYKEISKKASYKKKRVAFIWTITTIAAVIVLAIVLLPQIINNNNTKINIEQTGIQADTIDNKDMYKTATLDSSKPIIEGTNGDMADNWSKSGNVDISPTLLEKMKKYGEDDVLFHVRISIHFNITDLFTYEGKTLEEYRAEPIRKFYRNEYDEWYETIYIPMDEEMAAAEERGEEHAQGWWKHSPDELFEEYWYKTQPEDVITEYELAMDQYIKADHAYIEWTDSNESFLLTKEVYEEECRRFISLGNYLGVNTENSLTSVELVGYLTRQQIETLPANSEYGYIILWADGENEING